MEESKMELFDFNFRASEEEVQEALEAFKEFYRNIGNPHKYSLDVGSVFFPKETLPLNVRSMLSRFHEEGYVEYDGTSISLKEKYRNYHTKEELAEMFFDLCEDALENGAVFYDLYSLRTQFYLAYHLPPKEEREEKSKLLSDIMLSIAENLGVKHFIENPKAAGVKMGVISEFPKQIVQTIVSEVKNFDTREKVESFFETHAFCLGKLEYNKNASWINHDEVPLMDLRMLIPTHAKAQWLSETRDEKVIKDLLNYCGGCSVRKSVSYVIDQTGQIRLFHYEKDFKKPIDEVPLLDEIFSLLDGDEYATATIS